MSSPRLSNGSGLKQQITPPAESTNPLKLLEDVIGRSVSDQLKAHGKEAQGRLEKPAQLVEDIDFGGRSMHDFLEDEDEWEGIGSRNSFDDTAQCVMECEYV